MLDLFYFLNRTLNLVLDFTVWEVSSYKVLASLEHSLKQNNAVCSYGWNMQTECADTEALALVQCFKPP